MNWQHELQLSDLAPDDELEITCRTCGHSRYETAADLADAYGWPSAWLDEVAATLSCRQRGCNGRVRIALSAAGETEGFQGGLA